MKKFLIPNYKRNAAAITMPAPGSPNIPTMSAFNRLNGSAIILNADKPQMSAPPASEFISILVNPRVFSRVTQTMIATSATAATAHNMVSDVFIP